jgi:hypothetical protein
MTPLSCLCGRAPPESPLNVLEKDVERIPLPPRSIEPHDVVRNVFMIAKKRISTYLVPMEIDVLNPAGLENEGQRRCGIRVVLKLRLH